MGLSSWLVNFFHKLVCLEWGELGFVRGGLFEWPALAVDRQAKVWPSAYASVLKLIQAPGVAVPHWL